MWLQEPVNRVSFSVVCQDSFHDLSNLIVVKLTTRRVVKKLPTRRIKFNLNETLVAKHPHFSQVLCVLRICLNFILEVRRLFPQIESALERQLQWVVLKQEHLFNKAQSLPSAVGVELGFFLELLNFSAELELLTFAVLTIWRCRVKIVWFLPLTLGHLRRYKWPVRTVGWPVVRHDSVVGKGKLFHISFHLFALLFYVVVCRQKFHSNE